MNAKAKSDCTPRVYVGTYHKYNCGSIAGKWLNLEDYSDKDEFLEACAELHKDEEDPEYMFQDHENVPGCYITESFIDDALWNGFLELDEDDRTMLQLYQENIDRDADIDEAKDRYLGTFDSLEDYAEHYMEENYNLDKMMGELARYFDYESYARDLEIGGDISTVDCADGLMIFRRS